MAIWDLGAGADTASINQTLGNVGSTPLLSSGPASALSSVTSPISGAVESVGSFFQGLTGSSNLPLPNILSSYATYNYVLGISILSDDEYNDHTYVNGKQTTIICKSGHVDPNNRVNTAYGKFEYYIDNLQLDCLIGFSGGKNTNVTTMAFDIIEPYSMGLFMLALQTAAYEVGHKNWRDAPYLLTVEFRGNKETGQLLNIPSATRYIPFRFGEVNISVKESGTSYKFTGFAIAELAKTEQFNKLRSDVAVKGKTVQEVLQTGPKSLQAVVNERLRQHKDDQRVDIVDEILIYFPKDISSAASAAKNADNTESNATATNAPSSGTGGIESKLGVSRSTVNQTLVQPEGECNELGNSSLGFDANRKADSPMNDDNKVYQNDVWVRGNATLDIQENNFKFAQDSTITNAIDQILINSSYPGKALDVNALDSMGMRKWWRIDTQVYYKSTDENLVKTGTKPKLIVYRVVPYNAHSGILPSPNIKAPGLDEVKKNAVKVYDYIYTGKNSEVLRFDIDFSIGFANQMLSDNFSRSQDVTTAAESSHQALPAMLDIPFITPLIQGLFPQLDYGSTPTQVRSDLTIASTDKRGGGGVETAVTRAARVFHEAITNADTNMVVLDLEIMGDPFWIVQSGLGTYTASPIMKNLNSDGSVDYQSGEVDIVINFKTPIDINQPTGMYQFGGSKTAPVNQFSGTYLVTMASCFFRAGKFTQVLKGNRRQNQESKQQGTAEQVFHASSSETRSS